MIVFAVINRRLDNERGTARSEHLVPYGANVFNLNGVLKTKLRERVRPIVTDLYLLYKIRIPIIASTTKRVITRPNVGEKRIQFRYRRANVERLTEYHVDPFGRLYCLFLVVPILNWIRKRGGLNQR
jgi:hypothetical protein